MKNVIILGAGGHAKAIAECVLKSGDNLIGFLDDNIELQNKEIYEGKKVIGKLNDIDKYQNNYFIIGIGNNKIRKQIASKYNLKWYTAIHPSTIIATDVEIGEGSVIMPGVTINVSTKIGKHAIINTAASLDHDNIIEDYVHISPGSHIAGTVVIKESSWICIGATVSNNIVIGENNIIGAGAVVIKDILDNNSTYIGIPAKKL